MSSLGIALKAHSVPIEFNMNGYSTRKHEDVSLYSPPFYTGPGGYKMRICVNGNSGGAGTHVSVYVNLMVGEYDDRLSWPFRGEITIQLVNHCNAQDHWERTLTFGDAAERVGASIRVVSGERVQGWGYCNFITHTDAESCSDATRRYLNNDNLTFRVTRVQAATD